MPIAYDIDVADRLVSVTLGGVITAAETFATQSQVRADARFAKEFDGLLELLAGVELQLSAAEIRGLTELSPFGAGSRQAFVAPDDPNYGASRMLQSFAAGRPTVLRVFRDRKTALSWLRPNGGRR